MWTVEHVSPGTATGGGLNPLWLLDVVRRTRFPRDRNRGRIETVNRRQAGDDNEVSPGTATGGGLKLRMQTAMYLSGTRFPRDRNRGRIETLPGHVVQMIRKVSPGTATGGGLKRRQTLRPPP